MGRPYTEAQKLAKKGPLLKIWKLACVTNSPHKDKSLEEAVINAFESSLSVAGKLKWEEIKGRRGSKFREYDNRGKETLVVFFVKLAKKLDLDKDTIEDEVYAGDNELLNRKWEKYLERPAESDYATDA